MSKKTELEIFQEFVNSDYTNINMFKKLCKQNMNLTAYLCISKEDLQTYFTKIKKLPTVKEQYEYLIDKQPIINSTEEVYLKAIDILTDYLKKYINYHAFKLINAQGDINDYIQDLYQKFFYMANFYKDRWFHSHELKKATKVKWKPMTYKEFSYIARATIAGERRLKAYKFAHNPEASSNKISLSQLAYNKVTSNKSVKREDLVTQLDTLDEQVDYQTLLQSVNKYCSQIDDGKYVKKIQMMLTNKNIKGSKNENIVLKVCLYKAGITNHLRLLTFINNLSTKYKEKFGISQVLLKKQIKEAEKQQVIKQRLIKQYEQEVKDYYDNMDLDLNNNIEDYDLDMLEENDE